MGWTPVKKEEDFMDALDHEETVIEEHTGKSTRVTAPRAGAGGGGGRGSGGGGDQARHPGDRAGASDRRHGRHAAPD